MRKFDVVLHLDLDDPYHKEVVEQIRRAGTREQQRDFIVSSILYYARSPSYLTVLKMEDLLKKVEQVQIAAPVYRPQAAPVLRETVMPASGSPPVPVPTLLKKESLVKGDDGCSDIFKKAAGDAFS